jgi:hypothetical protein
LIVHGVPYAGSSGRLGAKGTKPGRFRQLKKPQWERWAKWVGGAQVMIYVLFRRLLRFKGPAERWTVLKTWQTGGISDSIQLGLMNRSCGDARTTRTFRRR